ncbi:hypothetical protein [Bradyrhizobium sp. RDI18]|uniref:hypothetical protein n=1 Tax=Bradyrhizobium sp. RDI18 TaxID=3367400 RepID=UPI00371CE2C4
MQFLIEQSDGCRVLLPAWMTESHAASLPTVEVPRLSLDSLRELRDLIGSQRISSSPSSGTTQTGGGDDDTMATAGSSGARDKRNPTSATRSDDRSEVAGLLKLLLNECSVARAKAKEADDE